MKIRMRGNSVRLRLLRSEVAGLGENGRVTETVRFGPGEDETLRYTVQVSDRTDEMTAGFCRGEICVTIPNDLAAEWIAGEGVGLAGEQKLAEGALKILVEKDFACPTRADDPDNADAFANPSTDC